MARFNNDARAPRSVDERGQMSRGKKITGWRALGKLVGHGLMGTAVFAIVAIPAIALHLVIEWLNSKGLHGTFTIGVLAFVKYAILVGDAALFLWLMMKAWYKASEEIEL